NQRGEFESAREHLLWSLDRFRAHGMHFESAVTLMQLGFVVYAVDGDMEGATALLDEASRLFSSVAHDWGVAACEATLGMIAALRGEALPGAEGHERAALECARAIGNEPLTGRALTHLGMIALLSGQMDTALGYLREAAEVLRGGRYQAEGVLCLFVL